MFPPQGSSWAEPYIKKISKTGQHDSRLVKLSCKARKTYLGVTPKKLRVADHDDVLNSMEIEISEKPENISRRGKCYNQNGKECNTEYDKKQGTDHIL